jgi:predicted PhzF superfamily epimerase YddE/YHI9
LTKLHVLRVFSAPGGEHGNLLGVFLDGEAIAPEDRQAAAAELGYSETVFVEDLEAGRLRIFTPATEFPFAGHPLVGTAWLMAEEGRAPAVLRPPAGEVPVRFEDDIVHIAAQGEWAPASEELQLGSVAEVEAMSGAPEGVDDVYVWAWIDESAGRIRARCFAPGVGIAEDEATGSAVIALCARLDRPISVLQGRGSELVATPLGGGKAEVGGRAVLEAERDWPQGTPASGRDAAGVRRGS